MAVPLGDGQVAAGLVLHVSKRFRDGIIVGYFDRLFPSIEGIDVEDLNIPFTYPPQYTAAQIVRDGDWPVVGRRPDLTGPDRIPLLRVVAHLYQGDELIGRVERADLANYPVLSAEGKVFVENKLRKHFARAGAAGLADRE